MELDEIKCKIKQLIISECDKEDEMEWQDIEDDEPLFGSQSNIQLDSLDALQLSLALKQEFGVVIDGSRKSKKYLESVNAMVDYIQANQQS